MSKSCSHVFNNGIKPFLIIDGHNSRLELSFLDYITNPDIECCVCLGVPYVTAYWQVGNSKQQNGSFKIYLTIAKQKIIERKTELGMTSIRIEKYEIIPIINAAFEHSFGNVAGTRTALFERGWNPLNRYLPDDPDIRGTMTPADIKKEKDQGGLERISANKKAIGALKQIASLTLLRQASANRITPPPSSVSATTPLSLDVNINSESPIKPVHLNLMTGMAGRCVLSLVTDEQSRILRQKIDSNRKEGKAVEEWLDRAKKITAGTIKSAGHGGRLDKNITAAVRKKAEESQRKKDCAAAKAAELIKAKADKLESKNEEMRLKVKEAWKKTRKAAMDVRQTGKAATTFTVLELKPMIRYKQGQGNREKTSDKKRDELLTMYEACENLPSPAVSDDEDEGPIASI
jgi:hypothetical protein